MPRKNKMKDKNQKEIDNSKMLHIIARKDILLLIASFFMLGALLVWICGGTIKETVPAAGVVNDTNYSTKISSPADGIVYELNFQVTDYVSKGDVIATLLSEKEADDGQERVSKKDVVEIKSEMSGFITEIYCYEGDKATKDMPVLRMVRSDFGSIDDAIVFVDSQELGLIAEGMPADITLDAFPEERYGTLSGRVVGIDTRINSQIRCAHLVGNEAVAASLVKQLDDYAITIHIDRDENGDFPFSKGSVSLDSIDINEACRAAILVREEHPYQMILGE